MNALDLPLSGVRLVEASAGTGKTFTIATLYLRLVLETHPVLERSLKPEEIVVATFTRAATAELAMRLRKRLRVAAGILRSEDPARVREEDDGETQATRAVIVQALGKVAADTLASRAREAELAMDTAVIGTLHSFCNRVLGEFGFETGRAPGEPELLEDARALQQEIVEDFWRTCSTDAGAARLLAETWRTPDALAAQVCDPRWRGRTVGNAGELQAATQDASAQREETLSQLDAIRNAIAGWADAGLQAADAELAACINHKGARDSRSRGLRELHAWARTGIAPDLLSTAARKAVDGFAANVLSDMKSCKRLPQGPVFAAVADLDANIKSLESLDHASRAQLLLQARAFLDRELPARMKALGVLGYDQAVDELATALDDPQRGARAVRAIRECWPVALVDEFQDTDPQQWKILKTLFAHERGGLVLVGDPKQAIYGFRGGDVHAWLMAKDSAQGAPLRLDESQRAGAGVNKAINALFSRDGAFVEAGITHEDVHPAPRVAQRALLVDGQPAPGLQVWQLPSTGITNKDGSTRAWNKGDAQSQIEAACVAQIIEWLEGASRGRVSLRDGDGGTRELCARDIAVLVNSNREARSMQRALSRAGVPAASCLRASVYASEEAADLRLLLEALRDPADATRARAARASWLVGDDAPAIARTCSEGAMLDALLTETGEWAALVQRRGPLPLLHHLIARAAPRLRALPGGDRRVANYLQLAELLQDDYAACFGIDDLCDLYARALRESAADTDADAVRLRLDTDAQAVQIATVHAAKGLEYGVVLLPCAASGYSPNGNGKKPALTWYHEGDKACVAVGNGIAADIQTRARREALAEDVRKFYVGVTRARAACVLPWGCVRQADETALHWLLHAAGREPPLGFDETTCGQVLDELVARGAGHIAVSPLPSASAKRLSKPKARATEIKPAEFQGTLERDWRTWSFSRLVRGEARGNESDPAPGNGDAPVVVMEAPRQRAPILAGARFGTAVHAALEHADFDAWRDEGGIPEAQRDLIVRSLRAQGLPEPGTVSLERAVAQVGDCMRGALNVPLACGARLCDVAPEMRRAEMDFHLRLAPSRVDALFALLHKHGYQHGRSGFGVARLHGMLTGVMDLVFEHHGRYHLVDYKTNLLPAYDVDALREAVAAHDYDLQYLLYVLALHRWLRQVLPGYDYDTHIGDVYYLFVRELTDGRGVHRDRPPRALVEAMDALFDGEMERAA
ncbi:MAG TPA: UvrD-helicase domain-containing protein [Rhodanobacteraceae bacterium]|nr:UvrD-helicase domain-containing protein [Rhodanobacteraceae bacterium]